MAAWKVVPHYTQTFSDGQFSYYAEIDKKKEINTFVSRSGESNTVYSSNRWKRLC
jgi:hypothetical protein